MGRGRAHVADAGNGAKSDRPWPEAEARLDGGGETREAGGGARDGRRSSGDGWI